MGDAIESAFLRQATVCCPTWVQAATIRRKASCRPCAKSATLWPAAA